jgi:hypothetical protein
LVDSDAQITRCAESSRFSQQRPTGLEAGDKPIHDPVRQEQ